MINVAKALVIPFLFPSAKADGNEAKTVIKRFLVIKKRSFPGIIFSEL
jgi:hypothetical protein